MSGGSVLVVLMVVFLAVIGIIVGIAAVVVRRVSESEKLAAKKRFQPPAERQAEWSSLTQGYDTKKGYDDRYAGSDGYELCREFLAKAIDAARKAGAVISDDGMSVTGIVVKAESAAAADALNPEEYLKQNFDLDDIRQMLAVARNLERAGKSLEPDMDQACVAAYDSRDPLEKKKCGEMISEALSALDPGIRIDATYVLPDGRTGTVPKLADISVLARLAGEKYRKPAMRLRERARAMSADGFRCRRCGRSPLSGGHMHPVQDETGKFTVLCDDCGGKLDRP